jgi:nitronate monooxygenase
LPVEKIVELIRETKALTDKPFAVNVFAVGTSRLPPGEEAETMKTFLLNFCAQNGFKVEIKGLQVPFVPYQLQLQTIIREKVPIVSFTFGIIDDESIETCKRNGTRLIGTATSVEESRLLAGKGY